MPLVCVQRLQRHFIKTRGEKGKISIACNALGIMVEFPWKVCDDVILHNVDRGATYRQSYAQSTNTKITRWFPHLVVYSIVSVPLWRLFYQNGFVYRWNKTIGRKKRWRWWRWRWRPRPGCQRILLRASNTRSVVEKLLGRLPKLLTLDGEIKWSTCRDGNFN